MKLKRELFSFGLCLFPLGCFYSGLLQLMFLNKGPLAYVRPGALLAVVVEAAACYILCAAAPSTPPPFFPQLDDRNHNTISREQKTNYTKTQDRPQDQTATLTTATSSTSSISTNPQKPSRSKSMSSSYSSNSKVKVAGLDKPLSPAAAAAYYRRQVRNGGSLTGQPSSPVVGVKKDASDTAAVLAVKADLMPKLWYHTQSQTAGTAALKAQNTNISPEIWKPDLDKNAASAALSARERTGTVKSIVDYDEDLVHSQGKNAAVKIAALSGRDYAEKALPDAYSFADRRDRSHTLDGHFSSSDTMEGLHNKLVEQQESRRRATITEAGLKSPSMDFLASLESKARANAKERLSKVYVGGHKPGTLHWDSPGAAAAYHASDAAALDDPMLLLTPQFLDNAQRDNLIAAARQRAAGHLSAIDDDLRYKKPFTNIKYTEAALKVAEGNSKKRLENHGKINMGGGMFMTQSEVEAIAQRNVNPVLEQISEKALKQREEDEERRAAEEAEKERKRKADLEERKKRAEEKRVANEQKAEDKRIKNEEKAALKAERDKVKAEQRAEKEKILAARRVERTAEKQKEQEAKAKTRHEKALIAEQRKQEKAKLKSALQEAQAAEALAAAEASRLLALKNKREAELEAARIAEEQAKSEAEAAAAKKELEEKQAALDEAAKVYDEAADKEKETHATVASTAASIMEVEREESIADAEDVEEESHEDRGIDTVLEDDEKEKDDKEEGETDKTWEVVDKEDAPEEAANGGDADVATITDKKVSTEASNDADDAESVSTASLKSSDAVKSATLDTTTVDTPSSPKPTSPASPTSPGKQSRVGGWFKKQAQKVKDQRSKVIASQQSKAQPRATAESKGKTKAITEDGESESAAAVGEVASESEEPELPASAGESSKAADDDDKVQEGTKVEEEEEKPLEPGIVEAVLNKDKDVSPTKSSEGETADFKPIQLAPETGSATETSAESITVPESNAVSETKDSEDNKEADASHEGPEGTVPTDGFVSEVKEGLQTIGDEPAQLVSTDSVDKTATTEEEPAEAKGIFKEAIA